MAFTITTPGPATLVNIPVGTAADTTPSITSVGGGGWANVWETDGDLRLRVFGADGVPGEEVGIDGPSASFEQDPSVTRLANGAFVVTWVSNKNGDDDIFFRRYNANGTPIDLAAQPANASDNAVQAQPSVIALNDGGFVVAWRQENDIYQRRFDAHGSPFQNAAAIKVNVDNSIIDSEPSITALTGGGWAVTWRSDTGPDSQISARRFGSDGSPLESTDILVNAPNTNIDELPVITGLVGGGFVVTWRTESGGKNIMHQLFDAAGAPVGPEVRVNIEDVSTSTLPSVVALPDGGWITTFTRQLDANSSNDIFQRRFWANGQAVDPVETLVSDPNTSSDTASTVTLLDDGRYVISWLNVGGVAGQDIYQRVYPLSLTTGDDVANGTAYGETLTVAPGTFNPGDIIDAKGGFDTLAVVGKRDLRTPTTLVGFESLVGSSDADLFISDAARLSQFLSISGGSGMDRLSLMGGGAFDFSTKTLSGLESIIVSGSAATSITLSAGADTIRGGGGKDVLNGLGGNDKLAGWGERDTLDGGVGNDRIDGGLGIDTLTGGKGKDVFVFDIYLNAKTNVDKITDFNVKDDSFQLDNTFFKKLGKGTPAKPVKLSADAFHKGKVAEDQEDRILYDQGTGALYYDADGTGAAKAIKFAQLKKGLALTHADFFVI